MLLALALAAPPLPPASNTRFSHTERTRAPAAAIWALWADVANWPRWDSALQSAALAGPFAVGSHGRVVPFRGVTAEFVLTALDPGRSYAFRTRLPLGALHVRRSLRQDGGHTQFTHEVWFTGLSKGLFGWLLGRKYRVLLPQVMAVIKAQAEQ